MTRGSPFRSISPRTNLLLLGALFLVGGVFIVLQSPPGGPNGVAAATTRGGRMLVMRPLHWQQLALAQEITVFDDTDMLMPRLAMRVSLKPQPDKQVQQVSLSIQQWNAVNMVRQQWCDTTPRSDSNQQESSVYDIGIHCQYAYGQSAKRIQLPESELPVELQQLLTLSSRIQP